MSTQLKVEQVAPGRWRLAGELDHWSVDLARPLLKEAAQQAQGALALDLVDLQFVDSRGFGVLLEVRRSAPADVAVRLEQVQPTVVRLLELMGAHRLFVITPAPPSSSQGAMIDSPSGEWRLPGVPGSVPAVRRNLEAVARGGEMPDLAIQEITLAVDEAAANAVLYGCPLGEDSYFLTGYRWQPEALAIEIRDFGPGFNLQEVPPADTYRDHGRGLHIMRQVMDEVSFESNGNGTTVRMLKSRR